MTTSEQSVDDLIADPSSWRFSISEEERERVRIAYVAHQLEQGAEPDLESLRIRVSLGFDGDLSKMTEFWNKTMLADAPDLTEVDPSVASQIQSLWRAKKLSAVVEALGLSPLAEWERVTVSACLDAPDQLRKAADAIEEAVAGDFALVTHEIVPDPDVVTWHLRRRKAVG